MQLLSKETYNQVENYLKEYNKETEKPSRYSEAMTEIIEFFQIQPYKNFLNMFYFNRHRYKNRYPANRLMLNYLGAELYLQESTLYIMRKEVVYKSAMIFYKYGILET